MLNLRAVLPVTAIVLGAIVALPAQAQSQTQLQQQLKSGGGDGPKPLPLHVNASVTQSVGSGTFVLGAGNNPTLNTTLTLTPLLAWGGFTFLLNQSYSFEYTQSDYLTTPYQVEMSDIVIGGRYGKWQLEDLNLMFIPSLSYSLPLSMQSRNVGSAGGANVGLRTIWNHESGVSVYGALSTGATLLVPALSQRFASQPTKEAIDDVGNTLQTVACNPRSPQELGNYACLDGGLPSVWRWSAGTGVSYSAFDGQLAVNADLSLSQGFSVFYGKDDEFTPSNARIGWTPRQSTSGNLSATWIPVGWFFLTAGLSSQQAMFTNNCFASDDDAANSCVAGTESNEHVRFPFWDFETPRDNNSSIYIDTTFSF